MSNIYSYIGTFEITSNVIDIADPYINSMAIAIERIPYFNEKMVKIRSVLAGTYEAYHVINDMTDEIIGLIIKHCGYSINDLLREKNMLKLGFASSGMSNAIVLVDEMFRFDTKYCYNPIEIDAYYDGNRILLNIEDMPYSETVKEDLKSMLEEMMNTEDIVHPQGKDILNIIGNLPVWDKFRNFNLCSSQWSVDVIKRLNNSYSNGACIKGGVVSTSPGGYLSCYSFRNHRGDTYAAYISLKESFNENTNIWDVNAIPSLELEKK